MADLSDSDFEDNIINVVAVDDDEEDSFPNMNETTWQDRKGVFLGRAEGVITYFESSVVLDDPRRSSLDDYRRAAPGVEVDSDDSDDDDDGPTDQTSEHFPAKNILSPIGFKLPERRLNVNFHFTQKFGMEWPVAIEWSGPMALMSFVDEKSGSVYAENLPSRYTLTRTKLDPPKDKTFTSIQLNLHDGYKSRCQLRFVFEAKKALRRGPPKPKGGLAADLFADMESRDTTLSLAGGETVKVHQAVLRLYSSVYRQRFGTVGGWAPQMDLTTDSKAAWELLLATLYDQPLNMASPHIMEATEIAMRDNFVKFAKLAWPVALKSIEKSSVLPLLRLSWQYRAEMKETAACVKKCLAFITQNMAELGSAWLAEYMLCLNDVPDLKEHMDGSAKKRRRTGFRGVNG